jgi:hypothetical protein
MFFLTALMDDVPNSHGAPTCSSMLPLPVSGKVKGAQDDVIQELQHKVHFADSYSYISNKLNILQLCLVESLYILISW